VRVIRASASGKLSIAIPLLVLLSACHKSPAGPSTIDRPIIADMSVLPQPACPAPTSGQSGPTYYVATNEPGADNERCDGRSPSDQGNGHCPFKDFLSARTFSLLRNVAGVRVEVRGGVYTFLGEGLSIQGAGNGESGRVVLTAYQNEAVVFDGRNAIREVIRLSGSFTAVERITVRNAAAYNIQVGGGADHLIQCTRLLANMSSDSLKGVDGARRTIVRDNEFSQWDSQAIDLTAVHEWRIENNEFHDPRSASGNAIGAKFGSRDIVITGNHFFNSRGLSFGGTSTPHGDDFEAYNLVAERNRFENVAGPVVKFYSCSNCSFSDNEAKSIGGGIVLSGQQAEGPSGCPGGCRASLGARVFGNRLTDLHGSPANVFWGVYSPETAGLSAGGNLYCAPPSQTAVFRVDGHDLDFGDWTRLVGTDSSSSVARSDQGSCVW
jgi:hypothetical protein